MNTHVRSLFISCVIMCQAATINCMFSRDVSIKLDLSDLGKQIGDATKNSMLDGARSFSDAANSTEFKSDFKQGMKGMGSTLAEGYGDGMLEFNNEARKTFFPQMKDMFNELIGTVSNTRNMLQFALPIAGGLAIIVTGYY